MADINGKVVSGKVAHQAEGKQIAIQMWEIGPEEAIAILELMPFDTDAGHQRKVRDPHVRALAAMMLKGEFFPRDPIVVAQLIREPAKKYLIDGQHRLWAIAESQVKLTLPVTIVPCANEEEVFRHYYTLDTGLNRTMLDMYPAVKDKMGITKQSDIISIASAVLLINDDFMPGQTQTRYEARSRDYRLKLLKEWGDEARMLVELYRDTPLVIRKPLMRAPVVAVALVTLRYEMERAKEFWGSMAQDDGISATDPRKVLLRSLLALQGSQGQRAQAGVVARMTAACWNYWMANQALIKMPGVKNPKLPIVMQGTPYRRGAVGPIHGGVNMTTRQTKNVRRKDKSAAEIEIKVQEAKARIRQTTHGGKHQANDMGPTGNA